MFNNSKKINIIIDGIIIVLLLLLPYYIFQGKLFIGGDDTRLFYVYPFAFIQNIAFHSWYNFSSYGFYNPNQFSLPALFVLTLLSKIIVSNIVLDYFAFSLPSILGYIYNKKLVYFLYGGGNVSIESRIGGLLYVCSPIIILNQLSNFLYAIWLIPLFPIISYYFLSYIKFGNISYVIRAVLYSIFFSLGIFSTPWLLGYLIPLIVGLALSLFLINKQKLIIYFIRFSIFSIFIIFSQMFWLLPFLISIFFSGSTSYAGQALSQSNTNTFASTVLSTAVGNILFPLLNHNHRQLAFDYNWGLKTVFENYYDKLLIINFIYILIIIIALIYAKKVLDKKSHTTYTVVFCMLLISLFLYTVNIGFFKDIFISFQSIPGIAMFRNFYDKFALGYIFIYSLFFTLSLIVINKKFYKKRRIINLVVIVVIILNALPIKSIIDRPLWKTDNIKLNITIPGEYTQFMYDVRNTVPNSTSILSLPFNQASYTFIKDESSNNVFSGTSPVKMLTGITDYSGNLSFPSNDNSRINDAIRNRDYNSLQSIFSKYNISYLFVTKNIPQEVKTSYLFDTDVLSAQDNTFVKAITEKKIISSKKGNYELYKLRTTSDILQSQNITYYKVNNSEYHIRLSHVKENQMLAFIDSYHPGWELYVNDSFQCKGSYNVTKNTAECRTDNKLMSGNELKIIFSKPVFASTHTQYKQFGNKWNISHGDVKDDKRIHYNNDGTFDIDLILYFRPQLYFYVGAILTCLSILLLLILLLTQKKKDNEKNKK